MIEYEIGFAVNKFDGISRTCRSGLFFKDTKLLWASGINPCSYDYTLAILEQLENVTLGKILEFEWGGGERTWFISKKEVTLATDNFAWVEAQELPTSEVVHMLQERKQLIEMWPKEAVFALLSTSFERIKNDPNSFWENEQGLLYRYKVIDCGIVVKLVLQQEDFELATSEYLNQLSFYEEVSVL